jgi:hypothetical protein
MFVNEKRIFTFLTLARIFKSQIGYTDGYLYFKHRRNDATHNRFISANEIFFLGPMPLQVQLISKLSSTPQKSRSRFITVFSTCKDAFLKFECHIFYIG